MKSKNYYNGGYSQPPLDNQAENAYWHLGKGDIEAGRRVDAAGVVTFTVHQRAVMATEETGTKLGYSGALASDQGKFGENAESYFEFEMDSTAGDMWKEIPQTAQFSKLAYRGLAAPSANVGRRGNWALVAV
jgi:hypothetical protein